MSRLTLAILAGLMLAGTAHAQTTTPGANGIPGAPVNQVHEATTKATTPPPAVTACEGKAMDKDGKPLTGAAKSAFVKKCVADAKG
jgi:hypothetical protein